MASPLTSGALSFHPRQKHLHDPSADRSVHRATLVPTLQSVWVRVDAPSDAIFPTGLCRHTYYRLRIFVF